jgi:hypothetical protein
MNRLLNLLAKLIVILFLVAVASFIVWWVATAAIMMYKILGWGAPVIVVVACLVIWAFSRVEEL